MSVISLKANVNSIRNVLQTEAQDYVKHIWYTRRSDCVLAAGEVLNKRGYLPNGTEWDAVGDNCEFYVERGGHNLTHYFHEGMIYGPNIPVFAKYVYANGTRRGVGEPIKYFSKPYQKKYPNGKYLNQSPGSHLGMSQWTKAFDYDRELYYDYVERCEQILLR